MPTGDPDKTKSTTNTKITAAHLAGLRPRPGTNSPIGNWDLSTAFVAGFALALLTLPELTRIFGFATRAGAPHAAGDLLVLLGFIAVFGIFPAVVLQHLFLQNFCTRPGRFARVASALVALALMFFATSAMKPLVGYEEKMAENSRDPLVLPVPARLVGDADRSPASALHP